jgi:tRNA threonylcarbamoyladenosine biosynthesis protein TsaB
MKILAFDLSTGQGSLAFSIDAQLLAQHEWLNDRRNSAPFFQALEEIVRAQGAPELIVVGLGPGSYTGTRIAISAAIGLQMTSGAQLCGVPSICAISAEDDFAVIGDARRGSFFFARISRAGIMGEIELLSQDQMSQRLRQTTLPIYTADEVPQFARVQWRFPRARLLGALALANKNLVRAPLEPIYLRAPHTTFPRMPNT